MGKIGLYEGIGMIKREPSCRMTTGPGVKAVLGLPYDFTNTYFSNTYEEDMKFFLAVPLYFHITSTDRSKNKSLSLNVSQLPQLPIEISLLALFTLLNNKMGIKSCFPHHKDFMLIQFDSCYLHVPCACTFL